MILKEHKLRNLYLPVFNRATYSRCKTLIDWITRFPHYKLTIGMASSVTQSHFNSPHRYIRKAHPDVKIHEHACEYPMVMDHPASVEVGADIAKAMATDFRVNQYDAVIVIGDRFETLPAAMAASYCNIPLVHVQGGEVTGNIDDKVRHAVTKLADYHFCATRKAKHYIIEMGEESDRVRQTGCPSLDIISELRLRNHRSKERYIMCMYHPVTTSHNNSKNLNAVLQAVIEFCAKTSHKCYWYTPNCDPNGDEISTLLNQAFESSPLYLKKVVNEEPEVFIRRLAGSNMILGNSSSVLRESSFLGVPAINIGERQGIRERAWNSIDVGHDEKKIIEVMREQLNIGKYGRSYLFGDGRAAEYIVRYLNKIDFTIKGTLTYPMMEKHKEDHFGSRRFKDHYKLQIHKKKQKRVDLSR